MKFFVRMLLVFVLALGMATPLTGCDDGNDVEEAVEDAGEELEETGEEIGDEAEDAADEMEEELD